MRRPATELQQAFPRIARKGSRAMFDDKFDKGYRAHPNVPSVDQSDRLVPFNLRQSGPTPVQLLISTRVRKSPFWHLSIEAGAWRATVYNRMYHPRGYIRPEDGGAMAEYDALVNRVTLWNVAVERQIRVKGPDAESFVNFVITRDAS
jgi:aminomethyltransferase